MKKCLTLLVLMASSLLATTSYGQGSTDYGTGIKLDLNPEKTKYIRVITWNQTWFRASQLNPGTTVGGEPAKSNFDISGRRLRMLAYSQVSKRYMILAHFGINNQTFINGGGSGSTGTGGYGNGKKPQMFFHDFWNEYHLILPTKENKNSSLSVGAGLHYFMGISRMTMASTLNFLTVDSPIFSWATIDNADQFARQYGFFAKGKLNKLEYRFGLNKPFNTSLAPANVTDGVKAVAVDNNGTSKWAKTGYVEYQFLDSESNLLPFKVGTYLGTKRVFNIGAGFYSQPEGTRSSVNGTVTKHNVNLMSVDAFLDMPIGKKEKNTAITVYSGFFKYNFGPNYLRNIGIMNIGAIDPNYTGTDKLLAGAGNAQPMIGTGKIFYTQVGLLLPKATDRPKMRVQPFMAYTSKNFDALPKTVSNFDTGINWLIDGHHAKITTQYSLRPGLTAAGVSKKYGEFIAQLQIYL
ncbi:MAG TPA: porin [Runella sp.]|nr:porin [Runella sp.]